MLLLTEETANGNKIILLSEKDKEGAIGWRTVEELDTSYSLSEVIDLAERFVRWVDLVI
jgi:hypothetical protein